MDSLRVPLVFGLFLLVSCGKAEDPKRVTANVTAGPSKQPAAVQPMHDVQYDLSSLVMADDLGDSLRGDLARDLDIIKSFDATNNSQDDQETMRVMEIASLDAAAMSGWLAVRLKYVISGNISAYQMSTVNPDARTYNLFRMENQAESENIAASNRGTEYYLRAKESKLRDGHLKYLRILINNKWVDLVEPRVGLMQIGPGFTKYMVNRLDPKSFANSAMRIEILFHEARHADGASGRNNLGFPHIICPADPLVPSELVGKPACDDSSNGAYSVGRGLINAYRKKCDKKCSKSDLVGLEALYLDSLSRIIKTHGAVPPEKDASPEKGFTAVDTSSFKKVTNP
ncbi:MAG: hypothetical protein NTX25_06605 [Proteobacteria bacterium]|nr:hypothetical protein [Pseudomonadota bacterium]